MRVTVASSWDGAPLPPAEQTEVTLLHRDGSLVVQIDGPFGGDPFPPGLPGPTPRLWEYEVVEVFVVGDREQYLEIELSPGGHHWVLQLEGIRNVVRAGLSIGYGSATAGSRWRAEASVPWDYLPVSPKSFNVFRMAGVGPARRWQAMAPVPGDRPDFHRLALFPPWPAHL